jgi:uncharacterized oligopeptide transporter (OPT) family protein
MALSCLPCGKEENWEKCKVKAGMSLGEIGNGVALGIRIGVSVLVEGALGWAMFVDWIKVAKVKNVG